MDDPTMVWATELSLGWEMGPRAMAAEVVRWELSLHTAVVDVLPATRADRVVVIHRGPARPAAWQAELREAGVIP